MASEAAELVAAAVRRYAAEVEEHAEDENVGTATARTQIPISTPTQVCCTAARHLSCACNLVFPIVEGTATGDSCFLCWTLSPAA